MEISTTIKDRIIKIADFKGIKRDTFIESLNQKYSNYRGKSKLSSPTADVFVEISTKYPEVNIEWLLTGEGDILRQENTVNELQKNYSTNMIPLYEDVETIGGTSMIANMSANNTVNEWIDAGDWFNGATAAIRHYGDSMTEYPSGCILVLREVLDRDLIIWGRNYCIETTEYRVTKKIYDYNDEKLKAYSSNIETQPDGELKHPVFMISKQKIKKIYQVLGYVVKEYSNGPVMITNN